MAEASTSRKARAEYQRLARQYDKVADKVAAAGVDDSVDTADHHEPRIQVLRLSGHDILLWRHKGAITVDDAVSAIADAAAGHRDVAGVHDLLLFEPGTCATLSADDLQRIMDAAVVAFPKRYAGEVKIAIVLERLDYGVGKLFCALLEKEKRVKIPAFIFINCRHALDWLGLRQDEIDRTLIEIAQQSASA